MKVHSDIPLALDEGVTEYKPGLFKKWFIPTSLFGRSLLIVVIPLLILQVGLAYVFYDRHWSTISRWFSLALAGEVALAAEWIDEAGAKPIAMIGWNNCDAPSDCLFHWIRRPNWKQPLRQSACLNKHPFTSWSRAIFMRRLTGLSPLICVSG